MAQDAPPEVGTVLDGYRFKGGDPAQESSWEQVAPIAAPEYGPGAQRLPNGAVVRYGPRGGMDTIVSATAAKETADAAAGGDDAETVGKLTEGQGKAMLYGGMMAGAERDYQAARREGYNPASARNQIARAAGVIPFDGDFFGRLIRDDISDAGNQAELRWAEGNLRQLTGAAATNPEIARVAAINFDRGNDELADQRYRSRAETYQGTRFAAGPGASQLPEYTEQNLTPVAEAAPSAIGGIGGIAAAARGLAPGSYEPTDQLRALDKDGNGQVSVEELQAAGMRFENGQWVLGGPADGGAPPSGPDAPTGPEGGPSPEAVEGGRGRLGMILGGQSAFMRGAMEQGPFFQEAAAGIGALVTGQDYGDIRDTQKMLANYDRANNSEQRNLGGIAGASAGVVVPFGTPVRALRGANLASRVGNRAIGGAAAGSLYTAGQAEGNALQRLDDAAVGAGGGAIAGVAAPAVGNALNRYVARPAIEGLQSANRGIGRAAVNALDNAGAGNIVPNALREQVAPRPLESGMRRFADRSPQQVNALNATAARFQAEEMQPTFADVVNDGGRGTLRALATRQTPARQAARDFSEGRTAGLQDRISTQARRTISDDPRQPMQIREEITTRRNAEANQNFGAVRGEMVSPDPEIVQALRAPALRPAIEEAATSALNRGDSETANMLRQLTDGALDNPNGVQMTVGMADRISRSLNGRAEAFQRSGNNDAAASYFALAERLRGGARAQVPGYDTALQAYGADSGLAKATELGEQFMSMEADQFAAAVARLTPEEQQIARAAARRAVERQAGTQGQAPGVAQRLANGREQGARSAALIGDAAPMQRAMGAELEAVRNAQAVNPGQGSQTSMNLQDAGNAAGGIVGAVTQPVRTMIGAIGSRIKSRGFNDQEAEAIVTAAIDPARTNELVNMLAERMSRREARNLARAIRYQATTSLPSDRGQ